MGFIDKYLFGKENTPVQQPVQPIQEVNIPTQQIVTEAKPELGTQVSSEDYNSIIIKVLEEDLEKGLDFYKFTRALSKTNPNLPEKDRYESAFIAWEASDISVVNLLETAPKYEEKMRQLGQHFSLSVVSARSEIGKKGEEVKNLEMENEQWLNKIEENKKNIETLKQDIQSEDAKITIEETSFNSAYKKIEQRFNEIKEKINQYLKTNEPATIK